MYNLPLVSIITPSFNQVRYFEATIKSVLGQDYPHIEYIIVDGNSTDGSVDVIKKYSGRLAWWVSEQDKGQTDAINKGFNRATGEILAWINSDDTYNPGAVSQAVKYLVENPEVGLVYADCNFIDEDDQIIGVHPASGHAA
jgi:glycosyltransferase involved in cell wall biosynthesis